MRGPIIVIDESGASTLGAPTAEVRAAGVKKNMFWGEGETSSAIIPRVYGPMFTKITVWAVPPLALTNPEPRLPGVPTTEVQAAGVKKKTGFGVRVKLQVLLSPEFIH